MLEPEVVQKSTLTIVGLEAAFVHALSAEATNLHVIGPLWCKLTEQVPRIPQRVGREMMGIIYGRPEAERGHPQELQYVAGVPVSSADDVPDGMVAKIVSAGTFAVFVHRGPIKNIADTVRHIYRVWLPQSAYEHAQIADVERYDHRFHPDSEDSVMEYWVSVKRRALS